MLEVSIFTTMDRLSQEVVDRVARHLFPVLFTAWDNTATLNARQQEATWWQRDSLSAAAYATISLPWQRAIEKKIFTLVKIRSPEDELMLRQIMARNPHRRDSVRYIKCNINLDYLDRAIHTLFPVVSDRGVISKIGSILRLVNLIRVSERKLISSVSLTSGLEVSIFDSNTDHINTSTLAEFPCFFNAPGTVVFTNQHRQLTPAVGSGERKLGSAVGYQ